MAPVRCWDCENILGHIANGTRQEERDASRELVKSLGGKCPKCGRILWKSVKTMGKPGFTQNDKSKSDIWTTSLMNLRDRDEGNNQE